MKKINLQLKKIGIPEDLKFYISEDDEGLSKQLEENGFREPHNSKGVYEFTNKEDVVLDIGANLGYFTLLSKNAKKIIGIEPIPQAIPILKKNISINELDKKAEVKNMAVGKRKEQLFIEVNKSLNLSGIVSKKNSRTKKIHSNNLTYFIEKYDANSLRMDVEGYEYHILLNKIPGKVNKISLELHSTVLSKKQIKELMTYFEKEGFKVKRYISCFPKSLEKYYLSIKKLRLEKLFVSEKKNISMKECTKIVTQYEKNPLMYLYSKYKLKKRRDCYLFLEK